MTATPDPADEMVVSSYDTLKVLTSPLRARIVGALAQPRTVKEVAALLGEPQVKLYRHVGLLETHDLIRVVATRTVGNLIEKHYQVAARTFRMDRSLLSAEPESEDQYLAHILDDGLETPRAEIGRSVADKTLDLSLGSPEANALFLQRAQAYLSEAQARAFHEQLWELLRAFTTGRKSNDKDGANDEKLYGVVLGFYPVATDAGDDE